MAHLHLMMAPRQKKMYWVIEGDITGCFDHIQHKVLMSLLKRRIQDRKLTGVIWKMLKAGIMEGNLFKKTEEGTPQGGIVSPLLANIYLHELDRWMEDNFVGLNYNEKSRRRRKKEGNAFYLRYADDFVVAWNGSKSKAEKLKADLSSFLKDTLHLELSQEKTHITHVTDGFDFLGFTVKRNIDHKRGYNELIFYPSKKSVLKLKRKIKDMTCRGTTLASVQDKIEALNYLLRGWSNYYRHSCASQTFSYIGSYTFKRMERWLRKKTRLRVRRIYRKYYRRYDGYLTWVGGGKALYNPGVCLRIQYKRFRHRPNPYLNVEDEMELPYHLSPYPGKRDWQGYHAYGEKWTAVRQEVLERDGFSCRLCGKTERVEVHHRRKYQDNNVHDPENLITLCSTCHRKVRNPGSNIHQQLGQIPT